ncbi:MAG: AAA family ATPase [Desulfuromonadales bacterium]|nr:AAA family ATPase [Desulfuromonadales bacterium]
MILRSIELESFGRFRGQTIEFRRGLNLVIGPNEAGKSTIACAVPAVLFGTDRLERFKPWGRNVCSAVLFFEGKGRTIQVKRNLITDEVELIEKDDLYHVLSQFTGKAPLRGRSASCREYLALLESLLGIADESLFRATYFFGHQPQEWSGEELAQKLRTLVSGSAETDYAEILDGLLNEHFQLTRRNPWGRDKQRDREYEEICQQLNEQGEAEPVETVPVFVEIDSSADIREQIEKLSIELEGDRQEYEKGLRYIEHVRLQVPETSENVVSTVVEGKPETLKISTDMDNLGEQLAAAGLPQNPPRELPELLSEAAQVRQEFAELQQPFSALNNREKKIPTVPWLTLGPIVVVLIAGMAVSWWQDFQFLWISVGAGICSSLCLGWGAWRQIERKKALAESRKERSHLEQKKLDAQKRQAGLSERCEAFGLPSSAVDLVRLQKLVTKHRELLEKFWNQAGSAVVETDACDNGNASEDEATEVGNASSDNDDAEKELLQLEALMTGFEAEFKRKELRLQNLRLQFNELSVDQDSRAKIPGTGLHNRKRELEERITVLRKAINLLAGAVDEFSHSHLARLNDEASKLFGKITGGRYAAIKLDENMAPSVQVDGRRWVPVDHFSRGTVDAIYMSLRIALAKVRDDGRSLPLMLDDPFVHLDQKRLATTLNLIDLASADGQLILFSHNLDLGKRAARERWHVVPLDEDTVDISPMEGEGHAGQLHLL